MANIKQTAGHDALGEFAPEFAHLNDDVLFGEVWNREGLSPKLRSIVTVSALIGKDITDSSLKHHLAFARANGMTQTEMAELLTHIAFYAGWPNAWAAFRMAKEVYAEDGAQRYLHRRLFRLRQLRRQVQDSRGLLLRPGPHPHRGPDPGRRAGRRPLCHRQ